MPDNAKVGARIEELVGIALLIALVVAGCGKKPEAAPSRMRTICEGQPLRSVERREQAMTDGYDINREFDCITKESWEGASEYRERLEASSPDSFPRVDLLVTDVNTAALDELSLVITISRETAAQIIVERGIRKFKDWTDLSRRIAAFKDPQALVYASTCGLTVDGQSLEGTPPNALGAARLKATFRDYNRR